MDVALEGESKSSNSFKVYWQFLIIAKCCLRLGLTLVHVPAHVAVAPSRVLAHAAAVVKIVAADETTPTVEARRRVDPGKSIRFCLLLEFEELNL